MLTPENSPGLFFPRVIISEPFFPLEVHAINAHDINIEEYVPLTRPTKSDEAKSLIDPVVNINNERAASIVVTVVIIVLLKISVNAMSIISLHPSLGSTPIFSRMRSNITMVSLIE